MYMCVVIISDDITTYITELYTYIGLSTASLRSERFNEWPVRALQFSPDGNWLLSSDGAGHVRVWPVNQHLTTVAKAAGIDSGGW